MRMGKTIFKAVFFLILAASVFAKDSKLLLGLSGFKIKDQVHCQDADGRFYNGCLTVRTNHKENWPGVTLTAPDGAWDCTGYRKITAVVRNISDESITVYLRVDNPGADGTKNCVTDSVSVPPGGKATLAVPLYPSRWTFNEPVELVGMRGYPQPAKIDPSRINQLIIFVNRPSRDYQFEVSFVCAEGEVVTLDAKTFFPFVDAYGQFIHSDWPGKIHSEKDFAVCRQTEIKDMTDQSAPADYDKWGGWTKGPVQKATGFFYAAKIEEQWWLVDPDGYLFWSHGVDCVQPSSPTPTTLRESYFQWLPTKKETQWDSCWGQSGWAPVGYYKDKGNYKTFDFARANLIRKYGADWPSAYAILCHQRLRSWGMNTIGNWSDPAIYRLRKTPYVATVNFGCRMIEGSEGYWGKFPDPFDVSFRQHFKQAVDREKGNSIDDPWCIGFFVQNELSWGNETSLSLAALTSPADQPAKKELVRFLTQKYGTVEELNSAWSGSYASWEAVLQSVVPPDKDKAAPDLKAFYRVIAEQYFKIIHDELKAVAPNQLYLGCRFAWGNDSAIKASALYCDVISFNRYEYSIADLYLPANVDKPVIIGEFHFGALDRGMFHTGLKETSDQNDRADKYRKYVLGALRNPLIVGTHWFQYRDQALTGRGDGENYQIGLVDICDTPYLETVDAVRQTGQMMYEYRYKTSRIK